MKTLNWKMCRRTTKDELDQSQAQMTSAFALDNIVQTNQVPNGLETRVMA
jgi:hypothetical protein